MEHDADSMVSEAKIIQADWIVGPMQKMLCIKFNSTEVVVG